MHPDPAVVDVLNELCVAVAADDGCALYVADADGVLRLAASTGHDAKRPSGLWRRLRHSKASAGNAVTLAIDLPGPTPSIVVLSRRNGPEFTQQDMSLVRLFARRLVNSVPEVSAGPQTSGWTQQLETIQRIAARLNRLASVEEVAAMICSETRQVISYDEAHVLISSTHGDGFGVSASANGAGMANVVPALPIAGAGTQAIARARHGGSPVLVSDIDLGSGRPGRSSMLVAPVRFEGRVSGVICLVGTGVGRFDDDDLRLLQILSDQAAVSFENARLLAGRDQLVHELAALLDVSEAAGRALEEVELARILADRMRRTAQTEAVVISRWDEGSMMLHELWREGVPADHPVTDLANSIVRRGVLRDGRTAIVHADASDPSAEQMQLLRIGARTLVCVPLTASGRTIGIVELISLGGARVLNAAETQTIEAMATLGATGMEKVRLLEQLRSAADMDLVTGVHNHRYLQERLRQEVARSARSHSPFAVLMLDLDNFKPVNDRHGHADGDRVLHNIGTTIKDHVRTSDIVARYGGDEFVVLMPDTPAEHADVVANRVVAGVLQGTHVMSDGTEVSVGISAGLAVFPTDGRTSATLLQAADTAMYVAKRSGGRQVERYGPVAIPVEPEAVAAPA